MKLHYSKQDGETKDFELGEGSITIGRSPDADIILLDDRVSRVHCGINLWDGDFYIKDLKSKNGTYVNGNRVEQAKLSPSDVIRVGTYTFTFEQPAGAGTETALREISGEMETGKGYSTLLKEIVDAPQGEAAASSPKIVQKAAPSKPVIRINKPSAEGDEAAAPAKPAVVKPVIRLGKAPSGDATVVDPQKPAGSKPVIRKLPTRPPIRINIKRPQ